MAISNKRPGETSHQLFLLTIIAKGLLGLVQLATAAAIVVGVTQQLPGFAEGIFKAELSQDPNDFLASKIITLAGMVPKADLTFYTV